jgi:hypothetical protein
MGTKRKQTCCTHEFQTRFNQRDGRKDTKGIRILVLQTENQAPLCKIPEDATKEMGEGFPDN